MILTNVNIYIILLSLIIFNLIIIYPHPLVYPLKIFLFIYFIILFKDIIEYSSIFNSNYYFYIIFIILIIHGIIIFIFQTGLFFFGFMQIFLFCLFITDILTIFISKNLFNLFSWIVFIYIGILILQYFIISHFNKEKWYIRIMIFPGVYFLIMKEIKDNSFKELQKSKQYDIIHKISKEQIDNCLFNLKPAYYITDTNLIIYKKLLKLSNINILAIPLFNFIGKIKFNSTIKKIYGKEYNYDLKFDNYFSQYFYVLFFKINK